MKERLKGSEACPRLCVYRSLNHIYAQIIDDGSGYTLVHASTLSPELREGLEEGTKTEQASTVGALISRKAEAKGISKVVFDRGGYKYHGRVKALAEAARKEGLEF
jgi:large subunit ribosomal protein L18